MNYNEMTYSEIRDELKARRENGSVLEINLKASKKDMISELQRLDSLEVEEDLEPSIIPENQLEYYAVPTNYSDIFTYFKTYKAAYSNTGCLFAPNKFFIKVRT